MKPFSLSVTNEALRVINNILLHAKGAKLLFIHVRQTISGFEYQLESVDSFSHAKEQILRLPGQVHIVCSKAHLWHLDGSVIYYLNSENESGLKVHTRYIKRNS